MFYSISDEWPKSCKILCDDYGLKAGDSFKDDEVLAKFNLLRVDVGLPTVTKIDNMKEATQEIELILNSLHLS